MTRRSATEVLMSMSDDVWARHANPLSGWSRISVPPLFVLAIWSRIWLGWWCLLPLLLIILWTWWNPRAFERPKHLDNWMSRGVMGERIWLARNNVPIPQHHRKMPHILASISAIGLGPLAWGLWTLDIWPTLAGLTLIMGGKLWFLDRMVWLEADHRRSSQPWHTD